MIGRTNATRQGGVELSIVVSVTSGSTVTATKDAITVTGTAESGSCTLIVPEAGTWSVTATLSGQSSDTQTISVVDSYLVSLTYISSTLNDNSWDVISEVSNNNAGANYWAVGDRRSVVLNGTVGNFSFLDVTFAFIIGFNHNSTYEGTGRIHFQFSKTALSGGIDTCFVDGQYGSAVSSTGYFSLNTSNTNSGGWNSSQMRSTVIGTSISSYSGKLIGALPSTLRSVLKSVTKYTDNTGGGVGSVSGNVTSTTDYMFLLSEYEVFGSTSYANTYESSQQAQYSYYSAGNSKIKYKHTDTANVAIWWLRSPHAYSGGNFVFVKEDGTGYTFNAYYSIGLAPGFCV